MTKAQKGALLWLRNHNGDGLFDRNGVLLAAGERGPVMRKTWTALAGLGLVEPYAKRRLRVTADGLAVDLRGVSEPTPCDFEEEFE